MVAPHSTLLRKLRNTAGIISVNSDLGRGLQSKYPQDYITFEVHKSLTQNQPWKEIQSPLRLETIQSSTQPLKFLQPTIVDKILVLCTDFPDRRASIAISTIYNRFFSNGNSLKTYYREVSHSRYIPQGNVYGWYQMPNPSTYYTDNQNGFGKYPHNAERLIEDVIAIASRDPSINWKYFDSNNNGYIDNLVVVHAGAEAAFTGNLNDLWSHVYIINPKIIQGKTVWVYALISEYLNKPTDPQVIGVVAHEHGHQLGLPDLYDTTYKTNGVGAYSLMGAGSWANNGITPVHLDAWSKYVLGFADTNVNPIGIVHLADAETTPNNIIYTTADPKEYFLVENRQKINYDKYLPSQGMFMWHINENKPDNTNPSCYLVGLEQADNMKDLENARNEGDFGDPFPGITNNRSFGTHSSPNSTLCNKSIKNMLINKISNSAKIMTFTSSLK